jgi:hypothetical protein
MSDIIIEANYYYFLQGKCDLKCKKINVVYNMAFLKYFETAQVTTLKWPFATCGGWRMG